MKMKLIIFLMFFFVGTFSIRIGETGIRSNLVSIEHIVQGYEGKFNELKSTLDSLESMVSQMQQDREEKVNRLEGLLREIDRKLDTLRPQDLQQGDVSTTLPSNREEEEGDNPRRVGPECPKGWFHSGHSCFKMFNLKGTLRLYKQFRTLCEEDEARPAVFKSSHELREVSQSYFASGLKNESIERGGVGVGARRLSIGGRFIWPDDMAFLEPVKGQFEEETENFMCSWLVCESDKSIEESPPKEWAFKCEVQPQDCTKLGMILCEKRAQ
jgi:hypothetical protein